MVTVRLLLDDGSEITIIEDNMSKQLGLKGPKGPFQLHTANMVSSEDSHHVSIHIQGTEEEQMFWLTHIRTIKSLPLWNQTDNVTNMQKQWVHLYGVKL